MAGSSPSLSRPRFLRRPTAKKAVTMAAMVSEIGKLYHTPVSDSSSGGRM